ncbi:MAG: PKD domain-containing protein, partial [Bacteroidetes bacterium]|nr:PKD domain-containing protein [Bacteroidota bacterium]
MKASCTGTKAVSSILLAAGLFFLNPLQGSAQCPVDPLFTYQKSCDSANHITFINQTDTLAGGLVDYYEWNFGDGNTSFEVNPEHTYVSTGFYIVSLIAYDTSGCSESYTWPVNVSPLPVANFTHSPDSACSTSSILFNSGTSIGSGLSFQWNFGDGSNLTSTSTTVSHAYNAYNNASCDPYQDYNVRLIVTDFHGCKDTIYQTITVKRRPQPSLSDLSGYNFSNCHNNPDPSNPNDTLTVLNLTPNMACVDSMTIHWGDGAISSGLQSGDFPLTHIYTQLGIFNLVFTAYGSNGCYSSSIYTVANQANPNVGLSAIGQNTGCAPFEMVFKLEGYENNSTGTYYVWDFGDGTTVTWGYNQPFINDTITHLYTQSHCEFGLTAFTVSVTAYNECNSATMQYPSLTVFYPPEAGFENEPMGCVGIPVQFINTSMNGYGGNCDSTTNYVWYFGDGGVSGQIEPQHIYTHPGTYNIRLVASNSKCGSTDSIRSITITGVHPDFSFDPVCLGDTMFFTDLSYGYDSDWHIPSPSVPIVQWHWDFGDGDTSNLQNPGHVYATSGVFTVSLTATSIVGCDSTISYDVIVDEIIIDSTDYGNVTCHGYNNGWIAVYATSHITPVLYTLLPPNISNNTGYFNNLAPGSYIITLDDTVCSAVTDTIVITEPDEIVIDSLLITQPFCYGEFGQAQVFASGGNSLIYTLYPGVVSNTTGLFTNLGHGSYYVIVEDTANCPPDTSNVFDIIVPDELLIDSVVVDHISCHGMNDGIVTIYASGGISSQPYIFNLTSGGSTWFNATGVFSGLLAGWYHPSVEDVNGCITLADSVEVIDPDPITVDSLFLQNISCYNANDGYIYVQASGGTGTLSYTLLPDSIVNQTGEFTSLAANIYNIRIEDSNGCILNIPGLTILNPDPIVIDSIDYAHITCHDFDDGQITVYASGGTGLIYTLLPDNLQNITGIYTGLDEGSYTISVSDSNNCPAVVGGPVTISNPPLMQVDSITAQDLSCPGANDGIVQAYASGGIDTLAYQYVLNPGTDSLYNSTGLFTGLAPGGFVVSVTDANGCTVFSDSVTVSSPYQLELDSLVVSDITCHDADDGIIEVYMLGGTGTLTYTLFPDSIVNMTGLYHNLDEGSYYVEVLDVNGCIFTIPNLIINNPAPILIDSIAYGHISCNNFNDGWFHAYGSGGTNLNYTLYPDNIHNSTGLFTGLDAGMYYVIVNDINGCPSMGSDTIEIINPSLLQIDSVLMSHLTCPGSNDGSIQVYASGGIDSLAYNFILNPASDSIVNQTGLFTGLLPGSYLVRVVDANGCIVERSSLEILSPLPIVIDSLDFEDITCHNFNNGIIEIYASGGTGSLTYTLWPDSTVNSTGIFTNLTENIYYVVIEDENTCSLTSPNIAINNPDAIVIDSLSYDHITCNNDDNGWIQIYAHGGINLNYTLYPDNISNASGYFDNLAGGTYQVGVSDDNSCPEVLSDTIIIVNPPLLIVDSLDVQQISCHDVNDGSIQAYASGGIDSVAYTYILNPGTDSIVNYTGYFGNLLAGNYRILVIDINGCRAQSSVVQIINPPALTLGFLDLEDVTCYNAANGHIVAQVSGGTGTLNYTLYPDSISNTSGIFSNLNGGNYWIRVTDVNACTLDIPNLVVFEPGPITIDSLNYENITCHDDNNGWIRAYASGGNTLAYTLYPDNITNVTGLFSGLDAGQYFIYVSDDNSCPPAISDTITIVNPDAMSIDSTDVQHLSCPGSNDGSIQVYASGGIDTLAYTYTLNPGNVVNYSGLFTGLAADIYTVMVTDVNGCSILSGNIPVHSPYQLVVDSLFIQDITCHNFNDGIIEVYMLGGTGTLTYTLLPDNISNTTGIFHNLAGNTYTVQVEDINGCIINIPNLTIINPDAIVLDSLVYQHISCHDVNDGSIRVYAHGGINLN